MNEWSYTFTPSYDFIVILKTPQGATYFSTQSNIFVDTSEVLSVV
jgi:hypothetical protein